MSDLKSTRALITGASGFLGQYVAAMLSAAGVQVFGVSRRSGYDLRNEAEALQAVLVCQPNFVIHLAAPPEISRPATYLESALRMGINMVRAAALSSARLIIVSRPGAPGSAEDTARMALLGICRAYAREHRFEFVQLVPCSLYGPLDRPGPGRPVGTMIEELISAKNASTPSIMLHGHPDAPCPLVFAADAAKAVVTACSLPGCHEPIWLFPKGDAGTFGRLAVDLARIIGYTGKVSIDGAEEWTPSSDGIMAREILGWESKTPLEVGLAETVQWRLGLQPVQSTGGGAKA